MAPVANNQNRFAQLLSLRRRLDRNREINNQPEDISETMAAGARQSRKNNQQPPDVARAMADGADRSQEVNRPSGTSDVNLNQTKGGDGEKVNLPPPLSPVGPNGAAVNQPDQRNQIDQQRQLDANKKEARGRIAKLKEKTTAKIDEFKGKMDATGRGATELLKQAWLNVITSFGLSLIWIHFHALLAKVFKGKIFKPLGSEWIPQEIIDMGGDELQAKIKKLGLIEWVVLILIDFILFVVILFIIGFLGMLVYYYFHPSKAITDMGQATADIIFSLLKI